MSISEINSPAIFRIAGIVDFYPQERILRNIITLKESQLYIPPARCLNKLIEEQGNIIGQEALIQAGWPESGERVTLNTLYQAISHLRKQLTLSFGDQDIITTVKRTGLFISTEVEIVRLNASGKAQPPLSIAKHNMDEDRLKTDSPLRSGNNKRLYFFLMLVILICSGLFYFFSQKMQIPDFYGNFHYSGVKNTAGCMIYYNNDESNPPDKNSRYFAQTFDCHGFTHAYITQWPLNKRSSAMLCNRRGDKSLTCKTYYYSSYS